MKPSLLVSMIAVLSLLAGCSGVGSTEVVSLAALARSGTLTFNRTQGSGDPPSGTLVPDLGGGACPILAADAQVTVNGRPAMLQRGGVGRPVANGPLQVEENCDPPVFRAPSDLAASPTTQVDFQDSTGSVRLLVIAFDVPRAFALQSSPDGALHRGDTVTVGWSPSSDGLDLTSASLVWYVDGGASSPSEIAGGGRSLTAAGNTFSFTVPHDAPIGGGHFALKGADFKPETKSCTGVATCKVDVFAGEIDLPAQIIP
jgi:hypothetical protein